jgi:hypothetical protein
MCDAKFTHKKMTFKTHHHTKHHQFQIIKELCQLRTNRLAAQKPVSKQDHYIRNNSASSLRVRLVSRSPQDWSRYELMARTQITSCRCGGDKAPGECLRKLQSFQTFFGVYLVSARSRKGFSVLCKKGWDLVSWGGEHSNLRPKTESNAYLMTSLGAGADAMVRGPWTDTQKKDASITGNGVSILIYGSGYRSRRHSR